ncbi:MAG: hypothetical protein RLY86_271 [Pseudomonadota bacterium]
MPSFAETLRDHDPAAWDQAVTHPFTVELGDGTLPDAVLARYLIQDYQFVSTLVSMVGYGVAKAPTMAAKARLSAFLAAVTSDENTYFQRSFDELGVPELQRTAPALHPVAQAFLEAMADAGERGSYAEIIATLLPAEWIYLDWAKRQVAKAPPRFVHREWIDLHAIPAFESFVLWLKGEMDAIGPTLSAEETTRVRDRFARMVALEVAFFETMYRG